MRTICSDLRVDYSIYKAIDDTGPSFLHGPLKFAANDLVFVIVVLVALTFLIPWNRRRLERRIGAVLATAAGGIALLIVQPIANAVDRSRPFVTHPHAHLLIPHGRDPGFPSDHATAAFALAMGLWLYDRTIGAIAFILAAIVAFARVYVGVHYPSDVVAGALIGMAVALILYFTPLRAVVVRIARACSDLWERILGVMPVGSRA
ncbi:MAG TPA: phosphatase PAP2 family protein [Thermoleophilaceae bacterium]|nr:phosphatase PAP2 family protein [Thermoleophilaceae bacterium]